MRLGLAKLMIILLSFLGLTILTPALAYADCCDSSTTGGAIACGANSAAGASSDCNANPAKSINSLIRTILNLLSVFIGAIAVIMIIVGGFRYVTSGGKQESVTNAKNTIVYALIGLVVVALAQILVHFVLGATSGALNASSTGSSSSGTTPTTQSCTPSCH